MRCFLEIAYDGTNYHGWQNQPNACTVQQVIEEKLSILCQSKIQVIGCGRTDAGVHASQFFMHFDTVETHQPEVFLYKLNRLLPQDIAALNIYHVGEQAHARFDAVSRTYQYHISRVKSPFNRSYSLYIPGNLNVDKMQLAANSLFQFSDFTSFSKVHTDVKTNICKILAADWTTTENELVFTISADRFLRNMVRAIVGSLLWVGEGKISVSDFEEIIIRKDRAAAGQSVPGKALFLTKVKYSYLS